MKRPRYEQHCANRCKTREGIPRKGTQWVHLYGQTKWVCPSCAKAVQDIIDQGLVTEAPWSPDPLDAREE